MIFYLNFKIKQLSYLKNILYPKNDPCFRFNLWFIMIHNNIDKINYTRIHLGFVIFHDLWTSLNLKNIIFNIFPQITFHN